MAAVLIIQTSCFIAYRLNKGNPSRRSILLYPIISSSVFFWSFLGASFVVCTLFLDMYWYQPRQTVEFVFGTSLLASLGIASLLSLVARKFAFPRMLEGMIAGSFSGSGMRETYAELCGRMNIRGVDLREATVGNAFSLNNNGWRIVAVSPEMVTSMSSAEVEAVIAHELSHLKNNDSQEKGFARLAKFAFAFDPILHLVEAAVHRERELLADQSSVKYTQKPLALASALLKVHSAFHAQLPGPGAGLFVGYQGKGLLSRYPDLERRVQLLIDMAREIKTQSISA
jgi:Zn-dependent protease with chaperone function